MMNKKIAMFTIAMVLLLGVTMGVTFALMTDHTETITNTFVAGNFGDLTLKESNDNTNYFEAGQIVDEVSAGMVTKDVDEDKLFVGFNYTVIPGQDLTKSVQVEFEPTGATNAYVYLMVDGANWALSAGETLNNVTLTAGQYLVYTYGGKVVMYAKLDQEFLDAGWEPNIEDYGRLTFVKTISNSAAKVSNTVISTIIVPGNLTDTDITGIDSALNFTAYAAQSEGSNNSPIAAFNAAFPGVIAG